MADRIIVLHAHPGRIRREIPVQLAHPRNFDSDDISEIVRLVRKEIEDEVNRVNAAMAEEYWNPQAALLWLAILASWEMAYRAANWTWVRIPSNRSVPDAPVGSRSTGGPISFPRPAISWTPR